MLNQTDTDVVIIGAGAAGLAAGATLQKAGLSFKLIEARNRIGGRAWTDKGVFPGIAYDKGCHWLHSAALNPFVQIADELEFRYKASGSYHSTVLHNGNGTIAPAAEFEASQAAIQISIDAIAEAARRGEDVPLSDFLDRNNQWYDLTRNTLAQMTSGDPENCSTLDFSRYVETGDDYPVQDGLGALLCAYAANVPVYLNTAAYKIDWSGKAIIVETSRGTIRTAKLLICIPPSVINAGGLRFFPELPLRIQDAVSNINLGTFEKFAFLLDQPIDGFGHIYSDVIHPHFPSRATFNLHMHEFGEPLLIGMIGGSVGRDLERAGEGAMYEVGLQSLIHAFGSNIVNRIRQTDFTHWTSDPWSLGAYSFCRPGHGNARQELNNGIDERLYFAGEHCSTRFFGTLHGAYLTGNETALQIATEMDKT